MKPTNMFDQILADAKKRTPDASPTKEELEARAAVDKRQAEIDAAIAETAYAGEHSLLGPNPLGSAEREAQPPRYQPIRFHATDERNPDWRKSKKALPSGYGITQAELDEYRSQR
jgi:hypothetical protein